MPLLRDDPEFWEWFTDRYAYTMEESAYVPAEFVTSDGTFDTWTWEVWVESRRGDYDRTRTD